MARVSLVSCPWTRNVYCIELLHISWQLLCHGRYQRDNLCSRNLSSYLMQMEEKQIFWTTETKIILGRYYSVYISTLTTSIGNSVNVSWFSSAFPVESHICHQIIMHPAFKLPVFTIGNWNSVVKWPNRPSHEYTHTEERKTYAFQTFVCTAQAVTKASNLN